MPVPHERYHHRNNLFVLLSTFHRPGHILLCHQNDIPNFDLSQYQGKRLHHKLFLTVAFKKEMQSLQSLQTRVSEFKLEQIKIACN